MGCVNYTEEEKARQKESIEKDKAKQIAARSSRVKEIIYDILYIKDERTNICFAYHYDGQGPALATVQCENIPSEMLIIP